MTSWGLAPEHIYSLLFLSKSKYIDPWLLIGRAKQGNWPRGFVLIGRRGGGEWQVVVFKRGEGAGDGDVDLWGGGRSRFPI